MKNALTLIFIVGATLFSPVSYALFPATPTTVGGVPLTPQNCDASLLGYTVTKWFNQGESYRSGCGDDAFSNASASGCFVRADCSGSTRRRYSGPMSVHHYECPANSTVTGTYCQPDEGYTAIPDGSDGWSVVPSNEGCDGNPYKFYHSETNTCTYWPCDGSTPYMFPDGSGGYVCSPPPDSLGCFEGDHQWIATGGSAGSATPENVSLNGCEYRPMTCGELAATGEISIAECNGNPDSPITPTLGCVNESCGAWYTGTGTGSYVEEDITPPMSGSPGGGGDTGGGGGDGGDTGGGDGGDGGDTGGGDGGDGGDTGGGDGGDNGGDDGTGDQDGQCPECDTLTNIKNLLAGNDTDGDSLIDTLDQSGEAQLDSALQSLFDDIQDWITDSPLPDVYESILPNNPWTVISSNATGGCQLPTTIDGKAFNFDLCEHQAEIQTMIAFFLFITVLWGVMSIVFERPEH